MELFVINIITGLKIALQPFSLFYVFLGTTLGLIGGALPGVTGTATMAMMLPFTYGMEANHSVLFLISILIGTGFGDSIPAILIKTPGTPTAVLTAIEGFKFHQRGEGGKALGLCLYSNLIGQVIGILFFITMVVPLARVAIHFLSPEIFALAIFGLSAAASLTGKNVFKGIIAVFFGLILATVGLDPISGQQRFTFGIVNLETGFPLVPVMIGLLTISEVFIGSRQLIDAGKWSGDKAPTAMPVWKDLKFCTVPILIGSAIGVAVGIMPGAGATVASFIAYQQARYWAKEPHLWGEGSREALTTLDASNSGAVGGELIPTLGLGIPGSVSMSVILMALMLQGIQPGPMLMQARPDLVYAVFGGLLVSTVAVRIIGYLIIRPAIRLATVPRPYLLAGILALTTVGVYTINWQLFDVYVTMFFGMVGYFMYRYGYPAAPAVLALVLGYMIESNFRYALLMHYGKMLGIFSRPITTIILCMAVVTFVLPFVMERFRIKKKTEKHGKHR